MRTIKGLRADNHLTQKDLAFKLGVNVKTISEWESGKVEMKPMHIYSLAYIFGINADEIKV